VSVTVKTLAGRQFEVYVNRTDSIASLKSAIEAKEGISTDHQRLIWAGKELEDYRTLKDYEFPPRGSVHLLLGPWIRNREAAY
jgi:ubiquitin-like protein Nedd8